MLDFSTGFAIFGLSWSVELKYAVIISFLIIIDHLLPSYGGFVVFCVRACADGQNSEFFFFFFFSILN